MYLKSKSLLQHFTFRILQIQLYVFCVECIPRFILQKFIYCQHSMGIFLETSIILKWKKCIVAVKYCYMHRFQIEISSDS